MSKAVLTDHQILLFSSQSRPPRKTTAATVRKEARKETSSSSPISGEAHPEEPANHRKAIAEYRERCRGADPWVSAEALLYLSDGDRMVERYALWLFPSESERFLVASNGEGLDEFYVLVRLEGKASLDKLSLGVCKSASGGFLPSFSSHEPPTGLDPTEGHVVRIVSIEHDGDPLQHPEDASPYLQNARHIREVIRKHAGKCNATPGMMRQQHFKVLRTTEYLTAKETMESDNCGPDEWDAALRKLDDPDSFPWRLANRVAELGALDKLREAEDAFLPDGRMHIVDDIWLVNETMPSASSEFLVAARWAVQKSIKGTGSIPRAKLWEPIVVLNHQDTPEFHLMRTA